MNTQEYIASGIIEAYVTGLASEEESRILECIQKHNPEVNQAIIEAQIIFENLASEHAIAPPVELKDAIWAKISELPTDENNVLKSVEPPVTIPLNRSNNSNSGFKIFAIAASILLLSSIALNIYLNNQQNNNSNALAALQSQQATDALAYQNLKSKWDLTNNPNVKTIHLLGVEKHPNSLARVYFEENAEAVYLSLENLPLAPTEQQYQLWAIVDGKPVDLGVFDQSSDDAVQKMKSVRNVQAFAITLEKKGGSEKPTMENMYVMGSV